MARSKRPAEPIIIHDLTSLVKLRVVAVIQDGRGKKADVYIVELHSQYDEDDGGRGSETIVDKCILKSFPATKASGDTFAREIKANSKLLGSQDYKTPLDAVQDIPNLLSSQCVGWPRCLGWLKLALAKLHGPGDWLDFDGPPPKVSARVSEALLLEYMPNLVPLTPETLDEDLMAGFISIVKKIHSFGIIHRDMINRYVWPNVGYNNLFIQHDLETGQKSPVVLDFNFAVVLGNTERDETMKEDEFETIQQYLSKGLLGLPIEGNLSKEVQRLLG